MNPLPSAEVAVVTRTKDRPTLLRRALRSVASQTFTDYVHIVVNDAGDPAAVEREIAQLDDDSRARISILHRKASTGMEAASNHGIAHSQSKYLVIHDDDDSWDRSFLEKSVARLREAGARAVATRTEVVFERVEGDEIHEEEREVLAAAEHDVTLPQILRRNFVPPISLLYERAIHDRVGLYDENLPVLGDWDFILRMLTVTPIDFLADEPLAFWHHRKNAAGSLGNSVVVGAKDHAAFEREVRDRYLRAELERDNHLGSLLFVANLAETLEDGQAAQHRAVMSALLHVDAKVEEYRARLDAGVRERQQAFEAFAEVNAALARVTRYVENQSNRSAAQFENLRGQLDRLEQLVYSQTPRQRARSYVRLAKGLLRRPR